MTDTNEALLDQLCQRVDELQDEKAALLEENESLRRRLAESQQRRERMGGEG